MYVKLNIYYIHLKYWIILSKYIHTKTTNTAEKNKQVQSTGMYPCLHTKMITEHCIVHKGKLFYLIIYIWYFHANYNLSGISVKRTSVKNLKSFKNPVCLLNKCSLFCYHLSWNLTYKRLNFPGNEYCNWYFILLSGFIVNIFCKMLWIIT